MNHFLLVIESFLSTTLLFAAGGDFSTIFILIFLALCVYGIVRALARSIKVVHSHWHQMFDTRPFTTLEFYESIRKEINTKGIEGVSFSNITHSERGILSANREYLRITFREYFIDVCAAPFAKESFFVSWWLGEAGINFRDVLISIPTIGKLFSKREKTFYEQDTEIMFKEIFAHCVKDTIEQLTESKGQRLDIRDWKGSDIKFNNK